MHIYRKASRKIGNPVCGQAVAWLKTERRPQHGLFGSAMTGSTEIDSFFPRKRCHNRNGLGSFFLRVPLMKVDMGRSRPVTALTVYIPDCLCTVSSRCFAYPRAVAFEAAPRHRASSRNVSSR